ncbi:hypothetical protein V6N12_034591 [Hibiscus sabdariffa]|uniref:Uncharacterized protein n=1 Tax=Hibiscus sabdariffa TaxID=183260 RepID=A0ABR2DIK7_9ROSI
MDIKSVAKDCCQIEKNKVRTSSPATDFEKEGASTKTPEGVYCQALNEKGVGPPSKESLLILSLAPIAYCLPNEVPGLFWSFNFHPGQMILSSTGSCGSSYRAISCIGHCPAILQLGGKEAEERKVLWPSLGADLVPFYGCGEVDEDHRATSEYVPTPNPSTTIEHKTLFVSDDEYTKFFQHQASKLIRSAHGPSSTEVQPVSREVERERFKVVCGNRSSLWRKVGTDNFTIGLLRGMEVEQEPGEIEARKLAPSSSPIFAPLLDKAHPFVESFLPKKEQ